MLNKSLINKKIKETIPAFNFIPQESVVDYIRSHGIELKDQRCYICGREITLDNIGVIFDDGEHILFVCNECLQKHNIFTLYKKFLKQMKR